MKRTLVALALVAVTTGALADNSRPAYNNGYAGGGPLLATMAAGALIGYIAGQRPVYVSEPSYIPVTNQPVTNMPFSGVRCELHSEMINGQLVQGQLCR
jgi:hypothetical protein